MISRDDLLVHDQICWLTARELVAAYARGTLSPVEVTKAMLSRIEATNGALNALYFVDADGAIAQAVASEERWQHGRPLGLIDGVPTTVKDALATQGMPSYRGSAAFVPDAQPPTTDTPAVARMREHGAVILGKTTMCDFGILPAGVSSRHGVTRNPWNTARNTGGSSSGAAAAVAAGIGPLTVGTDIVGSIRLPASFCGIFGHKSSQGRVPYYFPNSPALVAGPMTRDVRDAALLMNVLTQPDGRDFTALPRDGIDYLAEMRPIEPPARIRLLTDIGFGTPPHPEVREATSAAGRLFQALGFDVEEAPVPFRADEATCAEDFYRVRCLAEFDACPPERQRLAPVIEHWTTPARVMGAVELYRAFNRMMALRERAYRLLDGVDFLILPTVPVPAYPADSCAASAESLFAPWCNTFPFNLTEQPAASINCDYTRAGLPIGLQIVGRRFDDLGVLRLALTYEQARPPQRGWPIEIAAQSAEIRQSA